MTAFLREAGVNLKTVRALVASTRPWQWLKNLAVFPGIIFAQRAGNGDELLAVTLAGGAFCLTSGAVYLLNDVVDLEHDRHHPVKRLRPLARGAIAPATGLLCAALLAAAGLGLAFWLDARRELPEPRFVLFPALYLGLNVAYSLVLKKLLLVDVIAIAAGFMLRVIGGGAVISVDISSWLLVCTFFLALFMGLAKRRAESLALATETRETHTRPILARYDPAALDILIGATTAALLVSYVLYTVSDRTLHEFGTRNLFFTVPIAFYGVGRYLLLVLGPAAGEDPALLLARDRPLQVTALLWLAAVAAIIYC